MADMRTNKQKLLEIGEKQHDFGKIGIVVLICVIVFSFLFFLIEVGRDEGELREFFQAMTFNSREGYRYDDGNAGIRHFCAFLIYIGYAFSAFSVPFYFTGLHYIGLGQIVANTEKLSASLANLQAGGTEKTAVSASAASASAADEELPDL